MQLQSFRTRGFKNFRHEVALEGLERINVIHGTNNVGKSNLLEAIGLFFVLLDEIVQRATPTAHIRSSRRYAGKEPAAASGFDRTIDVDPELLHRRGYDARDIFNKVEPSPIRLEAAFIIDADECEAAHVKPIEQVAILLTLTQAHSLGLVVELERFQVNGDVDVLQYLDDEPDTAAFVREVSDLVARSSHRSSQSISSRYACVQVDRSLRPPMIATRTEDDDNPPKRSSRELVSADVWLALFDAQQSEERAMNRRWKLFLDLLDRFRPLVGEGAFDVIYNRKANRADLVFKAADGATIRAELLGSGVQQVVGLLGWMLMSGASLLSIEEPELNLGHREQLALKEALDILTDHDLGPRQLFFTSHTIAFETGEHFYAMNRSESGPVVEKRRVEDAPEYTQYDLIAPRANQGVPRSYISADGLVEVPESVRRGLGLSGGGGVRFILNKTTGHHEILSTEQFLAALESKPQSGDDDER